MKDDIYFMTEAISEAKKAAQAGDVPVGAVIVKNGEIIARAYNRRDADGNALFHAELCAIDLACRTLGGWRLPGCVMYVTLEPCPMCAGAIINSRIERVVFGAKDPKAGALGSLVNLNSYPLNHHVQTEYGVMAEECSTVLTDFFHSLRKEQRNKQNFQNGI